MLTKLLFSATGRNLNTFAIHHRSFPDLPATPLVPNSSQHPKAFMTPRARTFLLDGPASADASADASMFRNDCQETTSQFQIPVTDVPVLTLSTSTIQTFLASLCFFNIWNRSVSDNTKKSLTTHYQLPLPGLFQAFSLIALSSSSFHFRSSSSFAFCSCHFFSMCSWATTNLAWATSFIHLCLAAASCWICSRSASESESTGIDSGFMTMGTTVPAFAF